MNKCLMTILALGVSSSVLAAEPSANTERGVKPRMDMKQHFQRLDQDGNGTISREEAKTHPRMEKAFETADANRDGQLTDAEYGDHVKARMEQHREKAKTEMKARMDKADANRDGMLSQEEAKASPRLAKHFDAIDADKNGQVNTQEITDYMKTHRLQKGGKRC